MNRFALGLAVGFTTGLSVVVAREYARVYVSNRKHPWTEDTTPVMVPFRDRQQTQGEPAGSATIRTAVVRPRVRPEHE